MKDNQQLEFNFEAVVEAVAQAQTEEEVVTILEGLSMKDLRTFSAKTYGHKARSKKELAVSLARAVWDDAIYIRAGKQDGISQSNPVNAARIALTAARTPAQEAARFEAGRAYKGYTRSGKFRVFEVVRRTPCFIWVRGEMCLGTERHRVYEEDGTEKAIHDMLLYKYTIDSAAEFDPFTERMPEPAGGSTLITGGTRHVDPEEPEDEDTDTFAADEPEPVIEAEAPAIREDETWILGISPDNTITLRNKATGETKCLADTHTPEARTPDTNKQAVPTGCKANNTIRIPVRRRRPVRRQADLSAGQADAESLRVPRAYKPYGWYNSCRAEGLYAGLQHYTKRIGDRHMPPVTRKGDTCSGHECFPPRSSTEGSSNVFVNGIAAHRQGDAWGVHTCTHPKVPHGSHGSSLASGSGTVYCNGRQLGRVGDPVACGSSAASGSSNVYAGG